MQTDIDWIIMSQVTWLYTLAAAITAALVILLAIYINVKTSKLRPPTDKEPDLSKRSEDPKLVDCPPDMSGCGMQGFDLFWVLPDARVIRDPLRRSVSVNATTLYMDQLVDNTPKHGPSNTAIWLGGRQVMDAGTLKRHAKQIVAASKDTGNTPGWAFSQLPGATDSVLYVIL